MIHRTFSSLDDPPKLVGFTVRQWAALIAASSLLLGVIGSRTCRGSPRSRSLCSGRAAGSDDLRL